MKKAFTQATLAARFSVLLLAAAIVVYFAIAHWFDVLQFPVFAGDDLRSFQAATRGFRGFNEMMISFFKFRPITALLFGIVGAVTKEDVRAVESISLMIHTANAFLFFYLLYRRVRLPLYGCIGLTFLAIFNRFATYLYMQDSALTGGLAVALFLLILIVSLSFLERPRLASALVLVALFALIIYTYEPYLALAVSLIVAAVAAFRLNRIVAIVLAAGVVAVVASNLLIKHFFLRTPVLIGTETRPITFELKQVLSFLWSGALNVAGVNAGPAYLSLEDFSDSPIRIQLVSAVAALLSGMLVLRWIWKTARSARGEARTRSLGSIAFYGSTVFMMLLAASITFRQQYSWLYPAYLVFLSFVGAAIHNGRGRWRFEPILACLVLLSMAREIYLRQMHPRFFAYQADEIATNLYRASKSAEDLSSVNAIVIRGDVPASDWVFLNGSFSRWHHLPPLEFLPAGAPTDSSDESRLVLNYHDSDRSFRIVRECPTPINSMHRMDLRVLKVQADALLPDDRWSTPTKTPVFEMLKNGVDCMVEVSPVETAISAPPGATVLHVCFSHVYAIGDGTDLQISAVTDSGDVTLLSRRVPPLTDNDAPVWRKYELPLPPNTHDVKLRVFSKTDPSGDWLAFRDFSFE